MSQEFIPVYPTMAFATRRDHEIWIEKNAACEAREAAEHIPDEDVTHPDLDSTGAESVPAELEAPAPAAKRKRGAPAELEAPTE